MKPMQRVAFVGNYLPRRCGIATFTHDLHVAVSTVRPDMDTGVVAMTDPGCTYDYPPIVGFQVHDEVIDDYIRAAEYLNNEKFEIVCLQHEYGIFGGEAGGNVIELLSRLDMPIVTTLHTVLAQPSSAQRRVMGQIIDASAKVIVMAKKGRDLLRSVHGVPDYKIEVIPHGIPDFPFLESRYAKAKFGFEGKTVILTFGLLSPSKGIETVIDAMPGIVASCPNAVYVVLGATHPNLVRNEGEAYRKSLVARAKELGIQDYVVFFDEFVDQARLLDFISMCDVYVTPYLNESQMTSGTLAYSFGLGKAVVSTPYWHAKELLADGRGILVPFSDAKAIGDEISTLLSDDVRRHAVRKRAYAASRSMTWTQTAERYLDVFEIARARDVPEISSVLDPSILLDEGFIAPETRIGHFLSMCDSTGILQHAVYSTADRSHGYCIDDNARALLFAVGLPKSGDVKIPELMTVQFSAFIQHAWNPDTRRFRNFMSYDRRWLEDQGSEDSHGRALWALAECAHKDTDASRRRWATALFNSALPIVESFSSPRAWAFAMLGMDTYCALEPADRFASRLRKQLAERLLARFVINERKDWVWFEDILAYDNARLSQAMIQTGLATQTASYVDVGLRSLRWLMSIQTAPQGHFRPIGSQSFGNSRQTPEAFDQQPVEAAAAISACLSAFRAEGDEEWSEGAKRAFAWFMGENDLGIALIDPDTGGCSDGLHPDRVNENKGAESVLSYLLGLQEIRQFKSAAATDHIARTSRLLPINGHGINPQAPLGNFIASVPLRKPPEFVSTPGSGESRRQAVQARD
jgi:glycosyltransferase involved in cell wall biosynthesis